MATQTLFDGDGFAWDFTETNSGIVNGSVDAFDLGFLMTVNNTLFHGTFAASELGGRQLVQTGSIGAVAIERRLYVPNSGGEGWARFLESYTNTSGSPVTITVAFWTNSGNDAAMQILQTSSGDTAYTTADRWVVNDDSSTGNGGSDPAVAHVFADGLALTPWWVDTTVHQNFGTQGIAYAFDLTIQPGQTVSLMHFGSQQSTLAGIQSELPTLASPDAAALYGLTSAQLSSIANFDPDLPADARNDAFSTSELAIVSGNLFADNGAGADSDPDGPPLSISAVNGSAGNVGVQIVLASGALLTVNADGSFSYDPNGAFQSTPAAGSGAVNTTSADSFTYTLAGGDTATVDLTITGVDNNDTLLGDGGDNVLDGGAGDDLIYGGGGNDQLLGGAGNDLLDGGSGRDLANYGPEDGLGPVTVDLGAGTATGGGGTDTLVGIEEVLGTGNDDLLIGDGGDNGLNGGGGDDMIDGAGGDDWLAGSEGDDEIHGGDGNDTLDGWQGQDSLYGGAGDDQLLGGEGDDLLDGGAGRDLANYGPEDGLGPVTVDLSAGTAIGGGGTDTLLGIEDVLGTGNDDLLIGEGDYNVLNGGGGDDQIFGRGGDDTLMGGEGDDLLYGEDGDDQLIGQEGDDLLDGGAGRDWIDYSRATGAVFADLRTGMTYGADGADTLVSIEDINGSAYDDSLIGNDGDNFVRGGDGNDYIGGQGGGDYLVGEAGDDTIEGGTGNDSLDGGGGVDTASYANAAGGVSVNLSSGTSSGADGSDTLVSIENVVGSQFNDNLTGNGGGNVIDGLGGNDTINGGAGDDTLYGGDGNDFILGDFSENNITVTGNDVLYGGNGNDLLRGGLGNDTLVGGDGDDNLRGNGGVDYFDGGSDQWGVDPLSFGDRVSFFEQRATQGVVADLRTGEIFNDGFGNYELMVGIESLGADTAYVDTLYGNDGRNYLAGNRGDYLYGFGADDLFQLISAAAVLDGGAGIDRLTLFVTANGLLLPDANGDGLAELAPAATAGWTVDLAAGTTLDGYGNAGTITGIENVDGTHLGDTLIGDGNANVLNGGDGNDTIEGGGGNDTLDGGNGTDTTSFATATGNVYAYLYDGGSGEAFGAAGYDTLANFENLAGSAFNDGLYGNSQDNVVSGGDGHDDLRGGAGNDQVYGEAGDDLLYGNGGDDLLDGGAGYDRVGYYSGATAGVTVNLSLVGPQDTGQGWDTLVNIENVSGTQFGDTLTGDDNANVLWGSASTIAPGDIVTTNNDTISGGGGNDLLILGIGNHLVDGGSGIDTFRFNENGAAETGITLSLALQGTAQASGNGDWMLTNIENLSGSIANDSLTGDGNANVLAGDAGDDTLIGGAGDDTLYGDGQINWDTHGVGGSGPIVTTADTGGGGDDTLEGGLGDDVIDGGSGVDTASYANASGRVEVVLYRLGGGNGDSAGADGFDLLTGIENLIGSAYNDLLIGNDLANDITGGDGNDGIYGRGGNDTLSGEGGNDFINGGFGDDAVDGGAGYDRAAYFDGATTGVTVDLRLQGSAQYVGELGWDTLNNIEALSGTGFGDTLTGDEGDNWLWGSASGGGSTNNDTLDGQGGNDLLAVGIGDHSLTGGSGVDTVGFTENGGFEPNLIVSLALQGAAQATGAGNWTLNGVENLSGGQGDDALTGDGADNVLAGNVGNDLLVGGGGNDTLYGDGLIFADTRPTGGSGPITTFADATEWNPAAIDGNDTLEGGLGDDVINGGGGSDTASYANALGAVQLYLYGGGYGEAYGADGYDQLQGIENLTGGAFNDWVFGDDADNVLAGGDGHDSLRGFGGNDTLLGGGGDDFLNGGLGDDLIDGGAGFDRAAFFTDATAGVTVDLNLQGVAQDTGQGMDTLVNIENVSGTQFGDTLTGDGNDNALWGSAATVGGVVSADNNDSLSGGGGNDLLILGIGNHVVDGGSGIDTFRFTENGVPETGITLSLLLQGAAQASGNGDWTLTNIENLSGSIANDNLTGDGNANVLAGDLGDDVLVGGAGNDTLYGDGQIMWDDHDTGGSGPITTWADATGNYVGAVAGNDTLEGGLGDDVINGGGGSDTASYANASGAVSVTLFNNLTGNGTASGADGNDTLNSIENVIGSAYDDTIFGSAASNVLSGGDGNDFLQARGGDDTVYGGNGNDYLGGATGNDLLDGGAGYDRASFSNGSTGPVTVDLRLQGIAQNTGLGLDTLISIENVTGTAFGDTLIGDDGDNWLWGATDAAGVGDTIDGQGGNDLIEVGVGNHTLTGGTGIDTFLFNPFSSPTNAIISLALQGAAQDTGAGVMTLAGFENLSGSSFSDTLIGDDNGNVLAGSEANDTLIGGAGNDTLYGDGLIGTSGSPSGPITTYADVATLGGLDGDDVLEGGLGDDYIDGGGGIDTVTYANASGAVTINLFNLGNGNGSASGADGNDTLAGIENVTGSDFDDSLTGNALANVLSGGDGNDFLQARGGDDSLYGGDGNDYVGGGTGNDLLDGGAGWDRASFSNGSSGPVTVDLRIQGVAQNTGLGSDTLVDVESVSGTAFADSLTGTDDSNWLWGVSDGAGAGDTLSGLGGDDLLEAGAGDHNLDGGDGIDTFSFNPFMAPTSATISLALQGSAQNTGAGVMTLTGIENLSGSDFIDTLIGDGNANVLAGGQSGDTLVGGDGSDSLYGDGLYYGGTSPFTFAADVVSLGGFAGDDMLEGGLGNDLIDGGGGIDTATYANASGGVTVNLGSGTSSGADGNDTLVNVENITGSAFNDVLTGDGGDNAMAGGNGQDRLSGGGGDDSLQGGNDNDALDGGDGDDVIDGGAGFDRANYNVGATAGVTVNLATGQATGRGNDTLVGIEHVVGTVFNDVLTGDGGDNWLWGGSLGTGVTGNDTISGGNGNDLIEVGTGSHVLSGGAGNDTLSFWAGGTDVTSAGVAFNLSTTTAQNTRQGTMTGTDFENLSGSRYDDALTGNGGNNILAGNLGNDTLSGAVGNDTLYGDGLYTVFTPGGLATGPIRLVADGTTEFGGVAGNDTLNGGDGDDFLYGGGGNDILKGDKDHDTLYGGTGNDSLVGGQGNDRYIIEANSGADTITGFTHVDRIVFDTSSGVSSFGQLTLTATGGTNTLVTWGNGNSILIQGLRPRDLTAADFEFGTSAPPAIPFAAESDYWLG